MVKWIKNRVIAYCLYSYKMDRLAFGPWYNTSEDEGSKTLVHLSNRSYNKGS